MQLFERAVQVCESAARGATEWCDAGDSVKQGRWRWWVGIIIYSTENYLTIRNLI